jgi:hypothetical protein
MSLASACSRLLQFSSLLKRCSNKSSGYGGMTKVQVQTQKFDLKQRDAFGYLAVGHRE